MRDHPYPRVRHIRDNLGVALMLGPGCGGTLESGRVPPSKGAVKEMAINGTALNETADVQLVILPEDFLAEVLFCSALQPSDQPTPQQVRDAVLASWHAHHDEPQECVEQLAADYGNHPELACARMRWCIQMAALAA